MGCVYHDCSPETKLLSAAFPGVQSLLCECPMLGECSPMLGEIGGTTAFFQIARKITLQRKPGNCCIYTHRSGSKSGLLLMAASSARRWSIRAKSTESAGAQPIAILNNFYNCTISSVVLYFFSLLDLGRTIILLRAIFNE